MKDEAQLLLLPSLLLSVAAPSAGVLVVAAIGAPGLAQAAPVALTLVAWLLIGERLPGTALNRHYVLALLILGAGLRLLAQCLRANTILAAALTLDAYALAVLIGDHHRQQGRSPRQNAWLFAASLPLERALLGLVGEGLQCVPTAGPAFLSPRLPFS